MNEEILLLKIQDHGIKQATILATFYDQVCVGIYSEGKINFYKSRIINYELLKEIRIFNQYCELKMVYSQEKEQFITSYITDDKDFFDEDMYVNGNSVVDYDGKFTRLEQNNRYVEVPFEVSEQEAKEGLKIKVRNYFDEDKNDQIIISNNRLVEFIKGGNVNG